MIRYLTDCGQLSLSSVVDGSSSPASGTAKFKDSSISAVRNAPGFRRHPRLAAPIHEGARSHLAMLVHRCYAPIALKSFVSRGFGAG